MNRIIVYLITRLPIGVERSLAKDIWNFWFSLNIFTSLGLNLNKDLELLDQTLKLPWKVKIVLFNKIAIIQHPFDKIDRYDKERQQFFSSFHFSAKKLFTSNLILYMVFFSIVKHETFSILIDQLCNLSKLFMRRGLLS